jgi:hypothetical protein
VDDPAHARRGYWRLGRPEAEGDPLGKDGTVPDATDYATPGVLTGFGDDLVPLLAGLPHDPVELCRVAQGLVVPPDLAAGCGIPEERHGERSIRRSADIVDALLALAPTPLDRTRPPADRVVGTCRHFAVLSCAFLRHRGIAARARCGFATYFVPGSYVDHWVVERWSDADERWARTDPEVLGLSFVPTPEDLAPGEFLTGGEAWRLCREGTADPSRFGVVGAPHAWGIAEVRGNAVRDLAALNKVEMLPWDEWGRMGASYRGETGADYDALIDTVAETCAADDPETIRALYATEDLQVPADLIV